MADIHPIPTNPRFHNLTGRRFSRLVVLEYAGHRRINSHINHFWKCRCDCGTEKKINGAALRIGITQSCGCLGQEKRRSATTTHGESGTPVYQAWFKMIDRCTNASSKHYRYYGARGISVCERWMKFENFISDMGVRPEGLSLDRINNNGNYCPENCRWATAFQQGKNKRSNRLVTLDGRTMCLTAWAEELDLKMCTVKNRLRKGWSAEMALTTPVRKWQHH